MVAELEKEPVETRRDPAQYRSEMEALIGRTFGGRYRVSSIIGRGGNGYVFRARDLTMETDLAIKAMPRDLATDEQHVKRFNKEALSSSKLKHPNTIRVIDYGQAPDGYLYLVMELLEGQDLAKVLKKQGPMAWPRALHIVHQMAKAIGEAHQIGLVHRDLKPQNIFICDYHGEHDFVKVLDFGIAKFIEGAASEDAITQTGFICGTPGYIAPEQALGLTVSPRTDLYALGVILYELLAGHPPFRAETAIATVMRHIHEPPPPMTRYWPDLVVPAELERLVMALLAKDPAARPESTTAVAAWMDRVISESGEFPHRTGSLRAAPDATRDPRTADVRRTTGNLAVERSVGDADTDFIPTGQQRSPAPVKRKTRSVLWALAAMAVLAAAGGAWLAWGPQFWTPRPTAAPSSAAGGLTEALPAPPPGAPTVEAPAPPPGAPTVEAPAPTPAPTPQAEPDRKAVVKVRLGSTPMGAEVLEGDLLLGNTPVQIELTAARSGRSLVLRLAGHEPRTLTLDHAALSASGQDRVTVTLTSTGPATPAPARAEGTDKPKPPRRKPPDFKWE
jgi:serine/threonine-protein kinase